MNAAGPTKKKYESQRQLERQANILATAREMLAEIGYAGTTIRALAERADVAPGTLYNLYNSKDELIIAAVEELLSRLGDAARSRSAPGLDRIIALAEEMALGTQQNPAYAEAMTRALFGGQRDDPLTGVLYTRYVPYVEKHLRIAQAQGDLDADGDCASIARHLQAQNWGVVVAWIMGMIALEDIRSETLRSMLMTLLAFAAGDTRKRLQRQLRQLD